MPKLICIYQLADSAMALNVYVWCPCGAEDRQIRTDGGFKKVIFDLR